MAPSPAEKSDLALMSLKGELASMGVLDTDEGLRKGDLEALSELWGKLKSLGARAQRNGWVSLLLQRSQRLSQC